MKLREQKDRFLFIGERLLNAFITVLYIFCLAGIAYALLMGIGDVLSGSAESLSITTLIICIALFIAFLLLRRFSKYLEKKHFEFKEIVFGMDMLKGDLYNMQQNQRDPNYVAVPVKRGSLTPEEDLQRLIGLQSVKDKVQKLNALYIYEQNLTKSEKMQSQKINRHYAFIGNPGTGKTTVARIFAGLLYKSKRIKRNIYVECTGNDLISEFAGDTKNRIAKIYNKARRGVLFIDEAYVLAQSNERTAEALAQLLTYMENDPETVVIFAGYKAEMEQFIAMNSGLSSRISQKIFFEDYTPEQLLAIFELFAQERSITLSAEAKWLITNIFSEKLLEVDEQPFSNGRYARNCFDVIYQQHAINTSNGVYYQQKNMIEKIDIEPVIDELLSIE